MLSLKMMFLLRPENLVRFTADFRKRFWYVSSDNSFHSFFVNFSKSGWIKLGSLCAEANRFHGQTSWQISHPNIQLSILSLNSLGNIDLLIQ